MELIIKHFKDLTTNELFNIYKLRISIFVVEQNCPYQEVDDIDKNAYHLYLIENNDILAYARVFSIDDSTMAIGRVIATKRRCGLGSKILQAAINLAKEQKLAKKIIIEAQTYAKPFYEKQGFYQISDEFLEDGIPHIKMKLDL